MNQLEAKIRELVTTTCKYKPNSVERQQGLTKIVRMIVKSGKLWKDNSLYYEDALQKTWLYFCRNLCEANTGEKYDPNRSSVITWLNAYLRRRLQDFREEEYETRSRTASGKTVKEGEVTDLIAALPAPPDIPPILEMTITWAKADTDGELRRIHIQGYPHVNCQVLILRRLPPETSWENLSEEYGISVSTLTSFYRRQCLPRLRKFGEMQGYL
ncbi:hypothetical protein [Chroococcidiopsis sp. TS-821]|uniref:hypothetical protein n=1 Tax=Chroococcidiopsis sp. TS-821 TaxID=1378066 RepID=UPI000CEE1C00|nr:hypothetical protein [Chroococcidiopsis sp. TS-821]